MQRRPQAVMNNRTQRMILTRHAGMGQKGGCHACLVPQARDEIAWQVHDIDRHDDQPFTRASLQHSSHPGQRPHALQGRGIGYHGAKRRIGAGLPVGADEYFCHMRLQKSRGMCHQRLPVKGQQALVHGGILQTGAHACCQPARQNKAGYPGIAVIHPPM